MLPDIAVLTIYVTDTGTRHLTITYWIIQLYYIHNTGFIIPNVLFIFKCFNIKMFEGIANSNDQI